MLAGGRAPPAASRRSYRLFSRSFFWALVFFWFRHLVFFAFFSFFSGPPCLYETAWNAKLTEALNGPPIWRQKKGHSCRSYGPSVGRTLAICLPIGVPTPLPPLLYIHLYLPPFSLSIPLSFIFLSLYISLHFCVS